jgi:CysZ protein
MILGDFLRALGQIGDPRFRRVLLIGVALTLALLVGVYALFLGVVEWLTPEVITIPIVGEVRGLGTLLSLGSALFMVALSVFLMVPVASAFTGLFLEDVAQAVEDRHYPTLPPALRIPMGQILIDGFNFFGLMVAVNVLALFLYGFAGPFIPVLFWAINGYFLGREYFTMVAMRRLGRKGARDLRRRNRGTIWVAGALMAAPLSLPVINLVIPVLGVATFTHLFHRLNHDQLA